jgi:uridine phosphorylase
MGGDDEKNVDAVEAEEEEELIRYTEHVAAVETIMSYVISEGNFERRQWYNGVDDDESESYEEFLAWNRTCVDAMDKDEIDWLLGLCARLKKETVINMDMECCAAFTANKFYFDQDKKLVIVNPR